MSWYRKNNSREQRCRVKAEGYQADEATLAEAAEKLAARIEKFAARRARR